MSPEPAGADSSKIVRPDVLDRGVDVVDRARDALDDLRPHGETDCVLQGQPDSEEPLDDEVVKVATDPVSVHEDREPAAVLLGLCDLERQCDLSRKRGFQ